MPRKNPDEIKEWYREYMADKQCCRCHIQDPRVLQWHHLRDKRKNVGTMVSGRYSRKAILQEIAKCICLCANCHTLEHHGQSD